MNSKLLYCIFIFNSCSCGYSTFIGIDVQKETLNRPLISSRNDEIRADITASNTLLALEKIIFYYSKFKKYATVDFTFGLRMAEGEIARILHMADIGVYPGLVAQPDIQRRLKTLLEELTTSIKQALPFVEQNSKQYYEQFYYLIKEKWTSYQLPPQLTLKSDLGVFPNTTITDELEEEDSDHCMTTLLGDATLKPCSVDICWDKMIAEEKSLYYATHQVLWLMVGEKLGCRDQLNKKAIKSGYPQGIEQIFKRKCAGIVIEMEAITEDGVRMGMIDLFFEQGAICGSMGFMDAVRPQWLQKSFQWQHPNVGCMMDSTLGDVIEELHEYRFWVNYKREQWKSRSLLIDSVLSDGCSTHTTGVAAAYYATNLRLFFDPFYKRSQLDPYLQVVPSVSVNHSNNLETIFILSFCIMFLGFVIFCMQKRRRVVSVYTFLLRRFSKTYFRQFKATIKV